MYYADRPLPGGRLREKSTVDGRFQPSAIDFDRQRSIEGEKRKKKKKKKKKRKRRKKKKEEERSTSFPAQSSPAHRCRPRPRAIFLPRKETERLPTRGERSRR
ncbi:hypothetical protein BHE74_00058560, partial [Ensete ventricosum]